MFFGTNFVRPFIAYIYVLFVHKNGNPILLELLFFINLVTGIGDSKLKLHSYIIDLIKEECSAQYKFNFYFRRAKLETCSCVFFSKHITNNINNVMSFYQNQ
jgi:hypothetical protein